jgi:hypothetical protein
MPACLEVPSVRAWTCVHQCAMHMCMRIIRDNACVFGTAFNTTCTIWICGTWTMCMDMWYMDHVYGYVVHGPCVWICGTWTMCMDMWYMDHVYGYVFDVLLIYAHPQMDLHLFFKKILYEYCMHV